jgi:hypothetical protein
MANNKSDDVTPPIPTPPTASAPKAKATPAAKKPAAKKPVAKTASVAKTPAASPAAVPPVAPVVAHDPFTAPSGTPIAGYEGTSMPGEASFTPVPAGPPQGLSIASMITGISSILLSFVAFGFLPGVAAVVTGHMAQKKQPYGRPFWLTGLITGYISVAIGLIALLFVIAGIVLFFAGVSQFGPSFRGNF